MTSAGHLSPGPEGSYCYYTLAPNGEDVNNPTYGGLWSAHDTPPSGAIYLATCYTRQYAGADLAWILDPAGPVWLASAPAGVTLPVTAIMVAETALGHLSFPPPVLHFVPDLASFHGTVVNANTWFWLTSPLSQTPARTTAGPVWAQIQATATLSIDPGDDTNTFTCTGAGTPIPPNVNPATTASPDCGHVYTHTSIHQPNQAYAANVTIHWTITYTGTGVPTPTHLADHDVEQPTLIPVGQIEAEIVPGH